MTVGTQSAARFTFVLKRPRLLLRTSSIVSALRSRGISPAMLADALGVSVATAQRIYGQRSDSLRPLSVEELSAVIVWRDSLGDHAFGAEATGSARLFWATEFGQVVETQSHDAFARKHFGIVAAGDIVSYAMRNAGMIEATLNPDASTLVRYYERGISTKAANAIVDWLSAQPLGVIERRVFLDNAWTVARHGDVRSGVEAIRSAPACARIVMPWRVERLALVSARHATMRAILRAGNDNALAAAERVGAMPRSAMFQLEEGGIRLRTLGAAINLNAPRDQIVGRFLRERSDLRYAEIVEFRARECLAEQRPTFYRYEGTAFGARIASEALMVPIGGGGVLSHSYPIERMG